MNFLPEQSDDEEQPPKDLELDEPEISAAYQTVVSMNNDIMRGIAQMSRPAAGTVSS